MVFFPGGNKKGSAISEKYCDRRATDVTFHIGDEVMVHQPGEVQGRHGIEVPILWSLQNCYSHS